MSQRDLFKFFLHRLVIAYLLLLAPWPGFSEAYGSYFRSLGQAVFCRENERRVVTFEAPDKKSLHPRETRIAIVNLDLMAPDGSGPVREVSLNARHVGWYPMALLIALTVASPIAWARRLRALVFGTLLFHGFMLVTLGLVIWSESTEIGLGALPDFWKAIGKGCMGILGAQIGLFLPVLIWILVTFRREDFTGKNALLSIEPAKNKSHMSRAKRA